MKSKSIPISNDGTVHRKYCKEYSLLQRIHFAFFFSLHAVNDTIALKIIRNGNEERVSYVLEPPSQFDVVPYRSPGTKPEYLIIGGCIFCVLTEDFLEDKFEDDSDDEWEDLAPIDILHLAKMGEKRSKGEQAVVLSEILASDITEGYEDDARFENACLKTFNGVKVKGLAHLAKHFDAAMKDDKLEFFHLEFRNGHILVLPSKKVVAATRSIMRTHDIPSDRRIF